MIDDSFIQSEYANAVVTPSDINEHLQTLHENALGVSHVTEMGIRYGVSTRAFFAARPEGYVGYDIHQPPQILLDMADFLGYKIVVGSSLGVTIDATDILFIDTLHDYSQLLQELTKHHANVRYRIIMHDTETFGRHDESGGGRGLLPAIVEFLGRNGRDWRIVEHYTNCNGLTILERFE